MRSVFLISATCLCATAAIADSPRLSVHARSDAVPVEPHEGGRRLIRLPTIEFSISVEARCEPGGSAESLSISIADTRKTLRGGALDGPAPVETSIRVPARQLAPLALDGFCGVDDAASATSLLVPAVLSAHLSLRCAKAEKSSIHYTSTPLDLRIVCAPVEGAPLQDASGKSLSPRNSSVRSQATPAASAL